MKFSVLSLLISLQKTRRSRSVEVVGLRLLYLLLVCNICYIFLFVSDSFNHKDCLKFKLFSGLDTNYKGQTLSQWTRTNCMPCRIHPVPFIVNKKYQKNFLNHLYSEGIALPLISSLPWPYLFVQCALDEVPAHETSRNIYGTVCIYIVFSGT